ncbi:MAG TPA: SsrA-binding protein SmpB [Alphaproteobacteria bacterium]|nr:SsrA-binding protein SmpB [Alphaproteobacteria bacterium]
MTLPRTVAQNRRARHDYSIEETVEAGIVLAGSEVKALRDGRGNLNDSYAGPSEGALWLYNAYIPEYKAANRFNHETRRPRKLLLHRRQVDRLSGLVQREGATLVPLSVYFNERGIAKVQLGLAHGKRKVDKRAAEKAREWQRDKARILRAKG